MSKSHTCTVAQKCIHVVSINGLLTILDGVAKNSVYFVVLWVLYSWNVILGTSTTITTGCHFLLQWFLHGCRQTMPHIVVFYHCLRTGSVVIRSVVLTSYKPFIVIFCVFEYILAVILNHRSKWNPFRFFRPYSGHLVRTSVYKRPQ